jgi:hypothetical protein
MLNNYRTTGHKAEISKIFDKSLDGENFIWQNLHGRRFIHRIDSIDFDPVLKLVHINLVGEIKFIHPSSEFYIKLAEKETVCKLKYMNHANGRVTCKIPGEVRAIENRSHMRFKIKKHEPLTATLLVHSDLMTSTTRSMQVAVEDISIGGISLALNDREYETLKKADFFHLGQINSVVLPAKVELRPIYGQNHKILVGQKYKNGHKCGFELSIPFQSYQLDQVLLSFPE